VLNVISGALGGIPGYHALSLTALAERMNVDARVAGLIAAAVPLAAVVFGASVIELIPRMIVGGVLVFLGLAFLVEWVWDKRKILPPVEYGVVLVILAAIIGKGFLPGVVLGWCSRSCCSRSTTAGSSSCARSRSGRPTTPTWTDPRPSGRRCAR
jgi:SulP family sulfate permease